MREPVAFGNIRATKGFGGLYSPHPDTDRLCSFIPWYCSTLFVYLDSILQYVYLLIKERNTNLDPLSLRACLKSVLDFVARMEQLVGARQGQLRTLLTVHLSLVVYSFSYELRIIAFVFLNQSLKGDAGTYVTRAEGTKLRERSP